MLVKNWMRAGVEAVDAEASVLQAYRRLKESGQEAVPVIRESRPVGMLTERDLRAGVGKDRVPFDLYAILETMEGLKVETVMTPSEETLALEATIEEASQTLLEHRMSSMPVVDAQGRLAGVITLEDLFKVFVSLAGAGEGGIQIGLQVADQRGAVRAVYDVLQRHGCRMLSMMSTIHGESGKRHVYIRACECDASSLDGMVAEMKKVADLLYLADLENGKREVYRRYIKPETEWFVG